MTATAHGMTKMDNAAIAELLAVEAENASGHLKLALKRACREAMRWPEEAFDLKLAGRSLTELYGVGPSIGRRIHQWIEKPPGKIEPIKLRAGFLTMAEAKRVLQKNPRWLGASCSERGIYLTRSMRRYPAQSVAWPISAG